MYSFIIAVKRVLHKFALDQIRRRELIKYIRSARHPWSTGYLEYREQYLKDVLGNSSILKIFRDGSPLPANYGFRLDARVVEIPWVLTHLTERGERFLDAGSALNYEFVLTLPVLSNKKLTIITLAPESRAYWQLGVSYVFGDLRNLDFREGLFDIIVCISTIEHVGMDNSIYTGGIPNAPRNNARGFLLAIKELRRVLKPGGILYITFPFGQYEDHGWFQQFNSQMLDKLIGEFDPSRFEETIFKYDPDGWKLSDRFACAQCRFFDVRTSKYFDCASTIEYPPDFPAGERAVACLELHK